MARDAETFTPPTDAARRVFGGSTKPGRDIPKARAGVLIGQRPAEWWAVEACRLAVVVWFVLVVAHFTGFV